MSSTVIAPSSNKSSGNKVASIQKDEEERLARARAVAIQHALSIEEKKNLHNKVLDMILTAYDLPSSASTNPAAPSSADVATFRQCLALFRPTDLDELVSERNIDDRCGYALCRNPNLKQPPKKVWDSKGRLVDKITDSQWCSKECKERNNFIRQQLSDEPAWLRQDQFQHITLLLDSPQPQQMLPEFELAQDTDNCRKQEKLADERDPTVSGGTDTIIIIEKENTKAPEPPGGTNDDMLEGLPIRTIGQRRRKS